MGSEPNDGGQNRSVVFRLRETLTRWRPRFRLLDLFWLSLLVALLLAWYQDHENLERQLHGQTANTSPSWSIDQLLGPPNTPRAGDCPTAWTSLDQNARIEWFIVEFPLAVNVAKIEIVETYNPGAVTRVCSVGSTGYETEIWQGNDPVKPVAGMGSSMIVPQVKTRTRRIKVYLTTGLVGGWNEIDAVALHSDRGKVQWATNSWASASYGSNRDAPSWFWP